MRGKAITIVALMIVSSATASAWGPTDPTDRHADPDGDKLSNLEEFQAGTNPLNPDTDRGGCPDGWEVWYGLDPTNAKDDLWDLDGDGWSSYREYLEGTDPKNPNTDGDRYLRDSMDPHPLIPDDEWVDAPGGIAMGSGGTRCITVWDREGESLVPRTPIGGGGQGMGNGNGQGQAQGQHEGSAIGQGQGVGMPPGEVEHIPRDADVDGLMEFLQCT